MKVSSHIFFLTLLLSWQTLSPGDPYIVYVLDLEHFDRFDSYLSFDEEKKSLNLVRVVESTECIKQTNKASKCYEIYQVSLSDHPSVEYVKTSSIQPEHLVEWRMNFPNEALAYKGMFKDSSSQENRASYFMASKTIDRKGKRIAIYQELKDTSVSSSPRVNLIIINQAPSEPKQTILTASIDSLSIGTFERFSNMAWLNIQGRPVLMIEQSRVWNRFVAQRYLFFVQADLNSNHNTLEVRMIDPAFKN